MSFFTFIYVHGFKLLLLFNFVDLPQELLLVLLDQRLHLRLELLLHVLQLFLVACYEFFVGLFGRFQLL